MRRVFSVFSFSSPPFLFPFLLHFPYVHTYIYISFKTTSKSNIIKGSWNGEVRWCRGQGETQQHKTRLKRTRAEKINSFGAYVLVGMNAYAYGDLRVFVCECGYFFFLRYFRRVKNHTRGKAVDGGKGVRGKNAGTARRHRACGAGARAVGGEEEKGALCFYHSRPRDGTTRDKR